MTAPKAKEPIGSIVLAAIAAGKENEEVLKLVKRIHPKSRTTLASISWYRSKVKRAKTVTKKPAKKKRAAAKG